MRKFVLPAVVLISLLAGAAIGAAAESNVYAKTANNYLVKAFGEVMAAPPDKAGHRRVAGDYIMRAIHEVKAWEAE